MFLVLRGIKYSNQHYSIVKDCLEKLTWDNIFATTWFAVMWVPIRKIDKKQNPYN